MTLITKVKAGKAVSADNDDVYITFCFYFSLSFLINIS